MPSPAASTTTVRALGRRAPDRAGLRAVDFEGVWAPDVCAPDVRAPDVRAPDVCAPDFRAPDARAADARAADVRAAAFPDSWALGSADC
ncbi:MAG: hypothetical protein ACM30G_03810 [Micromonosporaceae bacterium]